MKPTTTQDTVLNVAVLLAAWLIVIAACADPGVDAPGAMMQIAYAALE
jgi:hypothetical protein